MKRKDKLKILNPQKIREAILEIKTLQEKYNETSTIIVYHALDTALKELGWSFSNLLEQD